MKTSSILITLIHALITLFILVGCNQVTSQQNEPTADLADPVSEEWKKYWYAGQAELSRYELKQARYGEIHEGEAVLIFVTEDFLTDAQVKYERGSKENTASVLKLNHTKKFWTGVYPYSMMTSVFSPVAGGASLKVSTSVQEWCGHAYSQLNFRNGKYEGLLHSYFQSEADQQFVLNEALLEDELWAIVRMRPESLPNGEIMVIPSTQYLRLKHRTYQMESAVATKKLIQDTTLSNKELVEFELAYQDFDRVFRIVYEKEFPYSIVKWEEETNEGKKLKTTAVLEKTILSPYWSKNSKADSVWRKELGVEMK